jgi:hypothetical protein
VAIGDCVGKFLMIDRENLLAATRKVGRILVEMDIHQGLPDYRNRVERKTLPTEVRLPGYSIQM